MTFDWRRDWSRGWKKDRHEQARIDGRNRQAVKQIEAEKQVWACTEKQLPGHAEVQSKIQPLIKEPT